MAALSKRVADSAKHPMSLTDHPDLDSPKPPKTRARALKDSTECYFFSIASDIDDAHTVAEEILGRLEERGIVQASSSNVYVALVEAISNAVRHGNKGDREKRVEIRVEMNADCAAITVRDEGKGFDPEKVPDPCAPENLLAPGGRGVLLIRYIMDEVRFNKRGNEIVMIKYSDARLQGQEKVRRPRRVSRG